MNTIGDCDDDPMLNFGRPDAPTDSLSIARRLLMSGKVKVEERISAQQIEEKEENPLLLNMRERYQLTFPLLPVPYRRTSSL